MYNMYNMNNSGSMHTIYSSCTSKIPLTATLWLEYYRNVVRNASFDDARQVGLRLELER